MDLQHCPGDDFPILSGSFIYWWIVCLKVHNQSLTITCIAYFFSFLYKAAFFTLFRTLLISVTLVWYLTTCWMRELRKPTETVLTTLSVHSLAMATTLSLQIRRAVSHLSSCVRWLNAQYLFYTTFFVFLILICHVFPLSLQLAMALRTPVGTRCESSGQRSRMLSPKESGTLSLRQSQRGRWEWAGHVLMSTLTLNWEQMNWPTSLMAIRLVTRVTLQIEFRLVNLVYKKLYCVNVF